MSHLGGHVGRTNLEVGALKYLKADLDLNSMIDIGCGTGGMVQLARELKMNALGVDGDPDVNQPGTVITHDFSKGKFESDDVFDLGYSAEFLEHVEEKYQLNYMPLFQQCKYVLITAAPEKWTGKHHVNCRSHEYWLRIFNQYGFILDPYLSLECRNHSTMNERHITRKKFIKLRALVFKNQRYFPGISLKSLDKNENPGPIQKNIYWRSSKYHSIEFPHLNVTLPQVPGHIFKSTLPIVSYLDDKNVLE